ncbi:MAG: protein kinase family protein [Candidatus Moranbacteria bacterium]|nr:protein kinase family protein [Candidatus Moranbacteria bacterium]
MNMENPFGYSTTHPTEKQEAPIDYENAIQEILDSGILPKSIADVQEEIFAECFDPEKLKELYENMRYIIKEREIPTAKSSPNSKEEDFIKSDSSESSAIIERIKKKIKDPKNSLGKGNVAEVFMLDKLYCCKYIYDLDLHSKQNDISDEISIQKDATGVEPSGPVKVPMPYYKRIVDGHPVFVMEKINGFTLREVEEKKVLPKNFNPESFFKSLAEFIRKMNDQGIHHRDIHAGNIMIDWKTGNPVLIDFGLSKRGMPGSFDEDYNDFDPRSGTQTKYANDNEAIRNIRLDYLPILREIEKNIAIDK